MNLGQTASQVMELVRDTTNTPVEVVEDATLQVLAVVTTAKPGVPFHLVRVNPNLGNADYVIAYQCGFLLRQAALLAEDRWQFGISRTGLASVERLISGPGGVGPKLRLPATAVAELTKHLTSGILVQLRSMPIGMRIDTWISAEYPSLRGLQVASMKSQCAINTQVLTPQVREMTPPTIWRANVALNAAYATFAATTVQDVALTLPYEAIGFKEEGQTVVNFLSEIPDAPTSDRDLVDRIGKHLGISDWYQFLLVEQRN